MEANELRIGNLVDLGNRIAKVIEINHSACVVVDLEETQDTIEDYDRTKPLQITEKWLLKFGFERRPWGLVKGDLLFRDNIKNPCQELTLEIGNGFRVIVQHVHKLQNLYFELTGEELTFKSE